MESLNYYENKLSNFLNEDVKLTMNTPIDRNGFEIRNAGEINVRIQSNGTFDDKNSIIAFMGLNKNPYFQIINNFHFLKNDNDSQAKYVLKEFLQNANSDLSTLSSIFPDNERSTQSHTNISDYSNQPQVRLNEPSLDVLDLAAKLSINLRISINYDIQEKDIHKEYHENFDVNLYSASQLVAQVKIRTWDVSIELDDNFFLIYQSDKVTDLLNKFVNERNQAMQSENGEYRCLTTREKQFVLDAQNQAAKDKRITQIRQDYQDWVEYDNKRAAAKAGSRRLNAVIRANKAKEKLAQETAAHDEYLYAHAKQQSFNNSDYDKNDYTSEPYNHNGIEDSNINGDFNYNVNSSNDFGEPSYNAY